MKLLIDKKIAEDWVHGETGSAELMGEIMGAKTAQFLDLEGVESWTAHDVCLNPNVANTEALVRLSDLTDKLLPPVVGKGDIEKLEEMRDYLIDAMNNVPSVPRSTYERRSKKIEEDLAVFDRILDRIKGNAL